MNGPPRCHARGVFSLVLVFCATAVAVQAQETGDRVRATMAGDSTLTGEVTTVDSLGFGLMGTDAVMHSIQFGDLLTLERSVRQRNAWLAGYAIGAMLLIEPGYQVFNACMDIPDDEVGAVLAVFCMIVLVPVGLAMMTAGVVVTGPVGALIGAFHKTDVWEPIEMPATTRNRFEVGFRIPLRR